MLLRELQSLLARLYDAPAEFDVYDFLVTDAAQAALLQGLAGQPPTDEQLLLMESEDGLELSLYLDAAVLERLVARCPLRSLCEENIADYCTALEGVSHFTFLAWSAAWRRQTTRFELELQAEIDKFVLTAILVASQFGGRVPGRLHEWLFDRPRQADYLDASQRELYGDANRFAAQYCRGLMNGFLGGGADEALMPELRRFYRLSRARKLRRIVAAAGARS
jgi:hypothetical protein